MLNILITKTTTKLIVVVLLATLLACSKGKETDFAYLFPSEVPNTIIQDEKFISVLNNARQIKSIELNETTFKDKEILVESKNEQFKTEDPLDSFKSFFVNNDWIAAVSRRNSVQLYNTVTKERITLPIRVGSGPFEFKEIADFVYDREGVYLLDGPSMRLFFLHHTNSDFNYELSLQLLGSPIDKFIQMPRSGMLIHQFIMDDESGVFFSNVDKKVELSHSKRLVSSPLQTSSLPLIGANEHLLVVSSRSFPYLIIYDFASRTYDFYGISGAYINHFFVPNDEMKKMEAQMGRSLKLPFAHDVHVNASGDVFLRLSTLTNKKRPILVLHQEQGSLAVKKVIYLKNSSIKSVIQRLGSNFLAGLNNDDGIVDISYFD